MLQRLTYSHLPLIVGREHMQSGQETLKNLISSDADLSPGNQVWICNRQQVICIGLCTFAVPAYSTLG